MFRKIIAVKYKLNKLGKVMEKLCVHELRNWEKKNSKDCESSIPYEWNEGIFIRLVG